MAKRGKKETSGNEIFTKYNFFLRINTATWQTLLQQIFIAIFSHLSNLSNNTMTEKFSQIWEEILKPNNLL